MAHAIVCDGCRVLLYGPDDPRPGEGRELVIKGARADKRVGAGFPDGDFHWCARCAKIAFQAINVARANGWRT